MKLVFVNAETHLNFIRFGLLEKFCPFYGTENPHKTKILESDFDFPFFLVRSSFSALGFFCWY